MAKTTMDHLTTGEVREVRHAMPAVLLVGQLIQAATDPMTEAAAKELVAAVITGHLVKYPADARERILKRSGELMRSFEETYGATI